MPMSEKKHISHKYDYMCLMYIYIFICVSICFGVARAARGDRARSSCALHHFNISHSLLSVIRRFNHPSVGSLLGSLSLSYQPLCISFHIYISLYTSVSRYLFVYYMTQDVFFPRS